MLISSLFLFSFTHINAKNENVLNYKLNRLCLQRLYFIKFVFENFQMKLFIFMAKCRHIHKDFIKIQLRVVL